mmetsp:Transcript_5956/g.6404  ORF Transcript_5956/g.6404 Transcript_5956/m.6404 type:complete len:84 (-) Transcript_5956:188-439(-)
MGFSGGRINDTGGGGGPLSRHGYVLRRSTTLFINIGIYMLIMFKKKRHKQWTDNQRNHITIHNRKQQQANNIETRERKKEREN